MRTADRNALLLNVQFAIRHGLPIEAVAPEIRGRGRARRQFIEKLQAGAGIREALAPLGIRGRRAALLSLFTMGIDAADASDLAESALTMESDFRTGIVHALFYPCMLMVLTLFSWFYLASMGILPGGRSAGGMLLPAVLMLGLCVLFLLPRSMALKARWTRPYFLLPDAHLLFGILELLVRDGAYTPQALAQRIDELDLREAAGRDGVRNLLAGHPLSSVLARMPAARIIAGITPREEGIGDFARLMKTEAAQMHKKKAETLFLLLHILGLMLAGAAIVLLGAGVYMSAYGSGVPW